MMSSSSQSLQTRSPQKQTSRTAPSTPHNDKSLKHHQPHSMECPPPPSTPPLSKPPSPLPLPPTNSTMYRTPPSPTPTKKDHVTWTIQYLTPNGKTAYGRTSRAEIAATCEEKGWTVSAGGRFEEEVREEILVARMEVDGEFDGGWVEGAGCTMGLKDVLEKVGGVRKECSGEEVLEKEEDVKKEVSGEEV
ncbi:hypothetical protein P280DRAFT_477620 [Massarina eburnea CBS 473.64]|uniref:Uncharacterized protein n=1 Tax=Massarina eburnea CBS 473.64 TaxID=1395130 RepID=A0A6A6SAG2_9PLEO|nr:hypothetical protein P280DRAFT_477620 [Massarina eburnea CBS 473.64]